MTADDGTALRAYHERTKHSVARLRSEPHVLDWDNQPRPFKVYPDLSPIPLPTDLAGSQTLALDTIRDAASSTAPALDLRAIARLLYFSAGVLRRRTYPGGEIFFRAAACTGALYHIDVYLACRDLPDLAAGVYHFGPHDLALRRLRDGDHRGALVEATADDPAVRSAPVVLLLTSTFWRNAWKYRARTYRHCYWDSGTLLANLLAVAAAVGIPAHVVTGFVDATANQLLDVDPTREATLALVALGSDATAPPVSPPLDALDLATLPLSRHEVDQPLVREAHAASSLASTAAVRAWRNAPATAQREEASAGVRVPLAPLPSAVVPEPIEAVILRRGSTRRFPRTPIALDQLATIVDCATRGVPLDVEVRPDLYVIAHAVDGLEPGAYACEPDGRALRLLRPGDLRVGRRASRTGSGSRRPTPPRTSTGSSISRTSSAASATAATAPPSSPPRSPAAAPTSPPTPSASAPPASPSSTTTSPPSSPPTPPAKPSCFSWPSAAARPVPRRERRRPVQASAERRPRRTADQRREELTEHPVSAGPRTPCPAGRS